ncbi:Glycerophosphoryl diester phosphodiesterase [Cynara cardunculus var. scolymus]|uniref:glycerophosphodiester phosphodiesterase n=1 Tax=Cynara cardunculus var. scolymus TaxID=59895 RepID=A0A124SHD4_CYNCS|nr:Glycerophosphoryl diester phosphodiesterase [Cynara cardunculus var. scolymus]
MATKAVHVSDVPNLDHVPENAASLSLYATRRPTGVDVSKNGKSFPKFTVIGHRGHGMNILQSTDRRMKAFKENSILSFNNAAKHPIDYIEFDVQGTVFEKRATDLTINEFFSYGPQREAGKEGKSLVRKVNGKIVGWDVESDDHLCTLQEAFQKVNPCIGFNIELKFDDNVVYEQDHLIHVLQVIMKVVSENAKDRPIIFSSFQPDAALLMKKLQHRYPVYFLTNGGNEVYDDVRRNSLEEAKKLALEGRLDGIVSEVKAIFRNPSVVREIKGSNLSLLTYGKLNNFSETVHVQQLMGVDGVIVDLVEEITRAIGETKTRKGSDDEKREKTDEEDGRGIELSFLLNLISQVIQH